jgi:assimilatory nitrate reductase catalytic subunit
VREWTAERTARECGVTSDAVIDVARRIGTASRVLLAWTMGVNHSVQGAETVTLLNTIALVTGNIGRAGAAPLSITGQCNAMGTREAGGASSAPGYRPWDDATARAEIAALWNVDAATLPTERGRAYPDIIDGIVDGTIKGLWVIGTNPVVSFPDRARLEAAFDGLELLVVQDIFPTPTTARAHIVLPAAMWGEKDGTYTNSERRVSRVRKAVPPPGEAKSDFDIILALADRLGCRSTLFPGWSEPIDAFREWATVSAGRLCDYSGITYDMLDAFGGVQWPCAAGSDAVALGGTPRLYRDAAFATANGRAQLWCVEPEPLREPPCAEFPFVLNTGRTVEHWHTRTKTGRIGILERLAGDAWIEINPADAERLALRNGEPVRVSSRRGQIEGVVARVTATVRAGEVFLPFHFDEWCANRLTRAEFDPVSREPNYKQCAVRLEHDDQHDDQHGDRHNDALMRRTW